MPVITILFSVIVTGLVVSGIHRLVPQGKARYKKRPATNSGKPWPFTARPVLTRREREMFRLLVRVLSPQFIVLSQVDMKQVVSVTAKKNPQYWLNVTGWKSLDFVICDQQTQVIAVIELDDASHQRADRRRADAEKERVLHDAGVRLWRLANVPDAKAVKRFFGMTG